VEENKKIELVAMALRGAEAAHKAYESEMENVTTPKVEWPQFYAKWLIDNTPIGEIEMFTRG
jgi:hypothetical protein